MNNASHLLRLSFWIGAFIDALAALLLTFPALAAWISGNAVDLTPAFRSSNAQAAALMWGWTLLLLWASHRPVERRGVLVLTVFPVLLVLAAARVIEMATFQASFPRELPFLILQFSLIALFSYSLWHSHRVERPNQPDA